MENKYKELFEKIAPKKSDDELLRAVLDRKAVNMSEKKRFNKKAIIIPAVAAAVMLCTTLGVSAAYEWNIPEALSDVFNKSSGKAPDGVTFKEFNFNTVGGKELDYIMKFGDHEVQLKGVAADPHNLILFYDVVYSGVELKGNENPALFIREDPRIGLQMSMDYNRHEGAAGTEEYPALYTVEESDKRIRSGGRSGYGFLGSEGNIAHCYYWEYHSGMSYSGVDYPLNFSNLGLYTETDKDGESNAIIDRDTFEDSYEYTINLDFIDKNNCLDIQTDNEITLSNGVSGKVSHIQLTPFSACFCVCWGNIPVEYKELNDSPDPTALDAALVYNEFKVKLKDGTIMDGSAFVSFNDESGLDVGFRHRGEGESAVYYQEPDFKWLYPVNVSDIEALIIGNTTVPVN